MAGEGPTPEKKLGMSLDELVALDRFILYFISASTITLEPARPTQIPNPAYISIALELQSLKKITSAKRLEPFTYS